MAVKGPTPREIQPAMESIQQKILEIRDQKVIIDSDLAGFYGVSTKRLNEQVKRNPERFPQDFMFQITKEEKNELVANCDHLKRKKWLFIILHPRGLES